jgi:hypothetical protein
MGTAEPVRPVLGMAIWGGIAAQGGVAAQGDVAVGGSVGALGGSLLRAVWAPLEVLWLQEEWAPLVVLTRGVHSTPLTDVPVVSHLPPLPRHRSS